MHQNYQDAIFALIDVIRDLKGEITWRNFQIEAKDKEITRLKIQLEENKKER